MSSSKDHESRRITALQASSELDGDMGINCHRGEAINVTVQVQENLFSTIEESAPTEPRVGVPQKIKVDDCGGVLLTFHQRGQSQEP
jgi:hypothetical protein